VDQLKAPPSKHNRGLCKRRGSNIHHDVLCSAAVNPIQIIQTTNFDMAEIVGIIGSAIAVANSAGALSRALFDIVETIKNARKEIAEIAQQLHILSGTLHTLWDIMRTQPSLCRPVLFHNTEVILNQYRQVEKELRNLIDGPKNIARLTWYIVKPKVKALLKKVEAIKASLTLELIVVQLAREEFRRP
jgi:hypothetical protein